MEELHYACGHEGTQPCSIASTGFLGGPGRRSEEGHWVREPRSHPTFNYTNLAFTYFTFWICVKDVVWIKHPSAYKRLNTGALKPLIALNCFNAETSERIQDLEGGAGSLPTRVQQWGVAVNCGHWPCLCIQAWKGATWYQGEVLPCHAVLPRHAPCWCWHLPHSPLAAASPLTNPAQEKGEEKSRKERGKQSKVESSILNDLELLKGCQVTSPLTPPPGSLHSSVGLTLCNFSPQQFSNSASHTQREPEWLS